MDGQYRADLTVRLESLQTKEDLHILLNTMTAEGSTLDTFVWRLAESMIDILSHPQPSFAYAELAMFCRAEAARNILLAQATWLEDQLTTILRSKVQFICLYREILLRALREYLERSRLVTLPDCAGLTPAMWGDRSTPQYVVESRRAEIKDVIRQAGVDFQHVVALIGAEDPESRFQGSEMRHWPSRGDPPEVQMVPVEIHIEDSRMMIGPAKSERIDLLRNGWSVPRYMVSKFDVVTDEPIARPAKRPPYRPPWPIAVEGPRYAIAKDFAAFCDKREAREYAIDTPGAVLALKAFVEIANGRDNAQTAETIEERIRAMRTAERLRPAPTLALHHHFQKKEDGRRVTLPVFPLLIRNLKGQGLYWLQL
jgi:hypothetical protein